MAVKTAGTVANPLSTGGHWRLSRVNWPSNGTFVVIQADAEYTVGISGSRAGHVAITASGRAIGGRVIAQDNFHVPANPSTSTKARSRFLALLQFNRGDAKPDADFILTLSGSMQVTDSENPGTISDLFCGVASSSGFISYREEPTPGSPGQFQFIGTYHLDYSSPAGGGVIEYEFVAADVSESHTQALPSSSSSSIWFHDQFGNAVDTHRPCSELPTPGGPSLPVTKTEGWQSIVLASVPTRGYTPLPSGLWTGTTSLFSLLTLSTTLPNLFDVLSFESTIPRVVVGLNSDNNPIFDDLSSGDYAFRVPLLTFNQFVAQSPPQRAPKTPGENVWKMTGVFPLSPVSAGYDVRVGTNKPPPTKVHRALPLHGTGSAPNFVAGSFPPTTQAFTP